MSSSYRLKKRFEEKDIWSGFGDYSNHYIRAWGECHPDYFAIPIGRPSGPKICVKKTKEGCECGKSAPRGFNGGEYGKNCCGCIDGPVPVNVPDYPGYNNPSTSPELQGYHKNVPDLYDPTREYPVQISNPQFYNRRRMPDQQYAMRNDYIRGGTVYDGTGIFPIRTPPGSGDKPNTRFLEYGFDELDEPPVKWDVTQAVQPYPLWKSAQAYQHGQTSRGLPEDGRVSTNLYNKDLQNNARIV